MSKEEEEEEQVESMVSAPVWAQLDQAQRRGQPERRWRRWQQRNFNCFSFRCVDFLGETTHSLLLSQVEWLE